MTTLAPHEQLGLDTTGELGAVASTEADWSEPNVTDMREEMRVFDPAKDAERLAMLANLTESTIAAYEVRIEALTDVEEADSNQDKTIEELVGSLRAQQKERDDLKHNLACAIASSSVMWEELHIIRELLPPLVAEQAASGDELSLLQAQLAEPLVEPEVEFDRCPCGETLHDDLEATHLPKEHADYLNVDLAAKKKHYADASTADHYDTHKRNTEIRLAIQKERANMITKAKVDQLQADHLRLMAESAQAKKEACDGVSAAEERVQAFEVFIETEHAKLRDAAMESARAEREALSNLCAEKLHAYNTLGDQIDELERRYANADSLLRMFEQRQAELTAAIDAAQERLDDIVTEFAARRMQQKLATAALQNSPTSIKAPTGQTSRVIYGKQQF